MYKLDCWSRHGLHGLDLAYCSNVIRYYFGELLTGEPAKDSEEGVCLTLKNNYYLYVRKEVRRKRFMWIFDWYSEHYILKLEHTDECKSISLETEYLETACEAIKYVMETSLFKGEVG